MSFKVGDYLTPKKNKKQRTIYKCSDINEHHIEVETVRSVLGIGDKDWLSVYQIELSYRLATKQELISTGVLTQSVDFIKGD